jgi:phage gpG-like protein
MARQRRGKNTVIKLVDGDITFSMQDPQMIAVTRPLEHYQTASRNFTPVYSRFWAYHEQSIMRNFAAEGRPRKWAPLQPDTIADRIRRGFGAGPILQRSGRMMRGFRASWGPRAYRVWNNTDYWVHHQYGAPEADIPARPMLVLLPQDQAQFTRLAREHLAPEAK